MKSHSHVIRLRAARMQFALSEMVPVHVRACPITLEIHTAAVVRNVLPTTIAQVIAPVWIINAKIHVQAFAVQTLNVVY